MCAMVIQKNENPGDEPFAISNTDLSLHYAQTSFIPKFSILVSVFASYGRPRTVHIAVIRREKAF
jgi:hypothetical protein